MSDLLDRLNEHYAKLALEDSKRPWIPRPSALGGCLREAAFRLSGMEPYPNSPESMRTFELGHQRGAALEEIAKSWPLAQTQVEVEMDLGFSEDERDELRTFWSKFHLKAVGPVGRMLGTLDLWLPSERTIVDFKTSGVAGYKLADGDDKYHLQLQAYRHGIVNSLAALGSGRTPATRTGQPEGAGRGAQALACYSGEPLLAQELLGSIRCVLIYEAKDTSFKDGVRAGQLKEVEVPHTEELEERYQQRLKDIRTLLLLKARGALDPTLVAGVYGTKNDWRCREKDGVSLYCSIGKSRGQCGK